MSNKIFQIIFFLFFNILFSQDDIKIKIINDTIKKVSYFDQNNIVYSIQNTSQKNYALILDFAEFNEEPEYKVEPFFIGLPDYFIFEKGKIINPTFTFGGNEINTIPTLDVKSKDFQNFCKDFEKQFDEYDLRIAYRISKNIIFLKPLEEKTFVTKLNFPNYRGRYFNLKNKGVYFFQISLQNPEKLISKYYQIINKVIEKKYSIFTGQIFSNKIPLIFEVYNGL